MSIYVFGDIYEFTWNLTVERLMEKTGEKKIEDDI